MRGDLFSPNRHFKPTDVGLEYAGHRVEAMETQG